MRNTNRWTDVPSFLKKLATLSLTKKLVLSSLVITFIALAGASLLVTRLLGNYYLHVKEASLVQEGEAARQQFIGYLRGQTSLAKLQELFKDKEHLQNIEIVINNQDHFEKKLDPFRHPESNEYTPSELARVYRGQIVTKVAMIGPNQYPVISVGLPLTLNGHLEGVISIHSPLYDFMHALPPIYRLIWLTALSAMLGATVLTVWVSRKISRPLRDLHEAALDLAGGNLERRVKLSSRDEVGQLGTAFNYMASKLNDLEQTRRDFLASVSHELRSPLTSLRGFLQAIVDDAVPIDKREHYLNIALAETNRLTRLVNELLDCASMQSPDFRLTLGEVNLNEVIRRVLAKMEPHIVAQELDVEVSFCQPEPLISGDWDRLQQVFVNLVDNAVSFTPPGGKLSFRTEIKAGFLRVAVTDTGIGIPPDELPKIWERFHKVDKARGRTRCGTGLGLCITKHLVEAHGGKIEVESEIDKGTTFTVTLPFSRR
ncbi:alkaline phosphatase synthesis sensor protein PhoR [Peptococcaceae bacterium CEB3]|nr:alkaline phosphatase synthesis sensor protein PhoR [Peptococcaceae bacterium CEB3]